eukprot:TRINITY_DN2936_c0_g1_i12.p3 TRINITY_DN2936_c0_g1~~TRINITY_DN2936_c0_g1_i12.p3  ORF type:complete len:168 (+),score=18.04 TRINITY_DN2936_c0_g1_i12:78-506(+)
MGNAFTSLLSVFWKPDAMVIMTGLDSAGKTTMMHQLMVEEVRTPIPSSVPRPEAAGCTDLKFKVWNVHLGGIPPPRWRHPDFTEAAAVIFVVDSNDHTRIDESRAVLHDMLRVDILQGVPLLVRSRPSPTSRTCPPHSAPRR